MSKPKPVQRRRKDLALQFQMGSSDLAMMALERAEVLGCAAALMDGRTTEARDHREAAELLYYGACRLDRDAVKHFTEKWGREPAGTLALVTRRR